MREKYKRILADHNIECDVDDVVNAVADMLEALADHLKETEPYAVVSINSIETAASEVSNLLDYMD